MRRLRIAVATNGPTRPWQARCIDTLAAVEGVSIVRWLPSLPRRAGRLPNRVVPDAGEAVVADADTDRSSPTANGSIDVLLDLTTEGVDAEELALETWRFGFGRDLSRDLDRVVLEDYVRGAGITRIGLVREPGAESIREGWIQTVSCWHPADLERVLLTPADWPASVASARIGETDANENATSGTVTGQSGSRSTAGLATASREPASGTPPAPVRASLPKSALRYAAVGRRVSGLAGSILRNDDWNVGILDAPIGSLLTPGDRQPLTWLPRRIGHFAADPFGVERDGVLHLFYEDFDQRRRIGSIHHIALGTDGRFTEPEPVLELEVHLSYPFLVETGGTVLMLPEAAGSGDLVLFEATDFPRGWRPVATLLPGVPAIDASVVQFQGRWWMFANRLDRGVNHDLFIWHAPELLGPWTPHAANPVKTDVRSARSGGTPFVVNDALHRPSQDCSRIYGGRLAINRIEVLTPTEFEERPVRILEPRVGSPYPDGLHHLAGVGSRTMIDGNRRHFVVDALRARIGR